MALIESDLARKRMRFTGIALCVASGISLVSLKVFGGQYLRTLAPIASGLLIFGLFLWGLARPAPARTVRYWRAQWWGMLIAVISIGIFCLSVGAWNLVEGNASEHWPQVSGIVLSSRIARQDGGHGRNYSAEIAYRYELSGTAYIGSRVSFWEQSFDRPASGQSTVDRYPTGKKITVFYSPHHPDRAVLEPGTTGEAWLASAIGVVASFFALCLIINKNKDYP